MGATIHPHKGYLNTNFYVHVTGHEKRYSVYKIEDGNKRKVGMTFLYSHAPHVLMVQEPGDFIVSFDNGDEISIHVEDGYKFGGSSYKTSFIFDNCPWCFVVMYDRTYFYNRETKRSFVEPISPDKITEINDDFVIFENEEQEERTVFSLVEEKPILCISDLVAITKSLVVWKECIDNKNQLCIYVLGKKLNAIDRFACDGYVLDNDHNNILFYNDNVIKKISLSKYNGQTIFESPAYGNIVDVVAPNIVISYRELRSRNELMIYDIDQDRVIKNIELDGSLAEINGKELIDTWQRKQSLDQLDFSFLDMSELRVSALYYKIFVYPCDWDVFYSIETIILERYRNLPAKRTSNSKLCSVNTDVNMEIQQAKGEFATYGDAICFSNGVESFVRSANYDGSGYDQGGSVYQQGGNLYLYKSSRLYRLSQNGYWDNRKDIDLDFSYFKEFGIVKDKETGICQTLSGINLGKWKCLINLNRRYIRTTEYYVFDEARRIKATDIDLPDSLSSSLRFGLSHGAEGLFLCRFQGVDYVKEAILNDLFDRNKYKDVLLSENGLQIMHRDRKRTLVKTIDNGDTQVFENLSYVSHINGIRPLFFSPCSLLPRIVNPISGKDIDCDLLKQYQFVSPNGKLYAETDLKAYTEYYNLITKELLSFEEYTALCKKYSFRLASKDSEEYKEVIDLRMAFVKENLNFLKAKARERGVVERSESEWIDYFVDRKNISKGFTSNFIEERGVAVIKSMKTQGVVEKIHFGEPLWFLNYVAFSHDSRFVALAGRYPDGSGKGGLLLVYDLAEHKKVAFNTSSWAVWTTAFTKDGLLGAYSSEPIAYFGHVASEMEIESIKDKSFLTFSPDGNFLALSNQGYTSKYDKYGQERLVWGHQPSTNVFVSKSDSPSEFLEEYDDLSDQGLEGRSDRKHNFPKSVASVSFSNDNKRLMMVGNDGVVIIRNLHL